MEETALRELFFNIPYIFQVSGIPKRGTKKRTEFGFETIQTVVDVVSNEDAPIAAVFPVVGQGTPGYLGEAGQVTLRTYGDRLYAKALYEHYSDVLDVTPEMLSSFLERGQYAVENSHRLARILPDAPGTIHRGLFPDQEVGNNPIRAFSEDKWQSWASMDREQNRAKAVQLYNDLIVLDGVFWRAVPEPVYVLEHFSHPSITHTCARIVPITDAERRGKDNIYGLNAWDRMASDADERYGVQIVDYPATIFIEAPFSYDNTIERFIESISTATDHDGDLLKSFDVESMMRWAAMRDALKLARSTDFAPPALDALAAAAEHYAVGPKASKWAIDIIDKALAVQDRRSIDISLGRVPRG
jgi:hypothetical protein